MDSDPLVTLPSWWIRREDLRGRDGACDWPDSWDEKELRDGGRTGGEGKPPIWGNVTIEEGGQPHAQPASRSVRAEKSAGPVPATLPVAPSR